MPVLEYAGRCIEVNQAGYLLDGDEWTPEVAEAMAKKRGLERLGGQHWKLITLCREEAVRCGCRPSPRRLSELSGVAPEVLDSLFAGNTRALLAALAGLRGPLTESSH
jgi:tRNA 2-thiouridine synthesizing protein E